DCLFLEVGSGDRPDQPDNRIWSEMPVFQTDPVRLTSDKVNTLPLRCDVMPAGAFEKERIVKIEPAFSELVYPERIPSADRRRYYAMPSHTECVRREFRRCGL